MDFNNQRKQNEDPKAKARRAQRTLESETSDAGTSGQEGTSMSILDIDDRYRVPNKDERLHTKTLRTFFFMHSVGQMCRVRKTALN